MKTLIKWPSIREASEMLADRMPASVVPIRKNVKCVVCDDRGCEFCPKVDRRAS